MSDSEANSDHSFTSDQWPQECSFCHQEINHSAVWILRALSSSSESYLVVSRTYTLCQELKWRTMFVCGLETKQWETLRTNIRRINSQDWRQKAKINLLYTCISISKPCLNSFKWSSKEKKNLLKLFSLVRFRFQLVFPKKTTRHQKTPSQ